MAVFHRVFSSTLDVKKHWYALNSEVCGILPRKFSHYKVFKAFPSEIREVSIKELTTIDGGEVPAKWFVGSESNANKNRTQNVFVSSTLGVLAGILSSCKEENTKTLGPIKHILDVILELRLDNDDVSTCTPKAKKRPLVVDHERTPNHAHSKLSPPNIIPSSPPNLINQSSPPNPMIHSSPPNPIIQSSPPNRNYSKLSPPNVDSNSSCSSPGGSNEYSIIEIKNSDYTPAVKKRKIRRQANRVIAEVQEVCTRNRETLASVLAESCTLDGKKYSFARSTIKQVFDEVVERRGCKRTFKELLSEDTMGKHYESMRVPDWQCLLLKLEARTPDKSWQIFVNRTNLGKNKTNGTPIIPLKNHMKALREMVNTIVHDLFQVRPLPNQIPGYQINLASAIIWSLREQRLHGCDRADDFVEFHLKLDGRPLFGKDQINIGIVPAKHPYLSSQSSKAVYTVAIANCEENRQNIRDMIVDINCQKDQIKRNGICVDGKLYTIKFKVILDYKGFCLLLAKANDENFELGGKGLNVEFCMFCHAIRLCTNCDLGPNEVCLKHFSMCKANIGGFQGIRDDLTFLLEEDMTSINICALHCEMRNMENLLASLGLLCHEVDSLKECNEVLSQFGPKSFKKDRIHVVMKPGQESSAERHNIKVSSFSERAQGIRDA